jgi:hypothetical protein
VSEFQDRLWTELIGRHGALLAEPAAQRSPLTGRAPSACPERPSPARSRRSPARLPGAGLSSRRRRLAAGTLVAAVAASALALQLGPRSGGGSTAYAVAHNPDGSVTVTINELVGVAGANSALRTLGVPVRVAGYDASCTSDPATYVHVHLSPTLRGRAVDANGPAGGIRIEPAAIPAGDTLLLGTQEPRPGVVEVGVSLYRGAVPPCLPARAQAGAR